MTSLPEILLKALEVFPWMKGQDWQQHHHHSHMTTGWLVGLICSVVAKHNFWIALTVYLGAFSFHVLIKELWLDRHKNKGNARQRNVDLTTRLYGMIQGALWFLS